MSDDVLNSVKIEGDISNKKQDKSEDNLTTINIMLYEKIYT